MLPLLFSSCRLLGAVSISSPRMMLSLSVPLPVVPGDSPRRRLSWRPPGESWPEACRSLRSLSYGIASSPISVSGVASPCGVRVSAATALFLASVSTSSRRSRRAFAASVSISGETFGSGPSDDGQSGRNPSGSSAVCTAMVPYSFAQRRTPLHMLDDASKMDPYAVLRIPFLSERRRIREAYTRLCKKEHPDLHKGCKSMEWLMGEWAYRVLTDPQSRASYDTSRVLRNALSLTEGIFAFGFAAAQELGAFASDASEVLCRAADTMFAGASWLLNQGQEQGLWAGTSWLLNQGKEQGTKTKDTLHARRTEESREMLAAYAQAKEELEPLAENQATAAEDGQSNAEA
ncbi:unnamed protein product [Polarella glacialis]|uniref:J domain-containing protein n=1 Tax=Polarella glacialis TaxID=89957 RepID=A0A813JZI9_POLGL|nr:unnamed protein product [Polarella glacialis]